MKERAGRRRDAAPTVRCVDHTARLSLVVAVVRKSDGESKREERAIRSGARLEGRERERRRVTNVVERG